jgi:uncharacterized coiled-coil protein SlyX
MSDDIDRINGLITHIRWSIKQLREKVEKLEERVEELAENLDQQKLPTSEPDGICTQHEYHTMAW